MLDETGLNYNLNIVDLAEGANQSDEYLDINPMGLIPTIIDPAGPDGQEVKLPNQWPSLCISPTNLADLCPNI